MAPPDPRRRTLLPALLAAALAPAAVAALPDRVRVVAWRMASEDASISDVGKALAERGQVEGKTFRFEPHRHLGSDPQAIAEGARELVATRPDAILAFWPYEIAALLAATRTIPIVCGPIPDPVSAGFARSLRRPGGNVTGLSTGSHEIWEFVIGVLRSLRPALKRIVVLHSPGMPVEVQMRSHREAAAAAGLEWSHAAITDAAQAEKALASASGEALHFAPIVAPGLDRAVLEIAHRRRMLTFGGPRGTLMRYVRYFSAQPQRIAAALDQVLRGVDPAVIPFELPDRTHFSLDRTTARRVGVEFPPDLLIRATQVIDS